MSDTSNSLSDWKLKSLLGIAIVGMVCGITGSLLNDTNAQRWWFLANACLMTPLPFVRRDAMLAALQLVSLAGAMTGVIRADDLLAAVIPGGTAAAVIAFLLYQGKVSNGLEWLGISGVIALALGYADQDPRVYLAGGVILTVYTGIAFLQGRKIAALWCVLNLVFSATSAIVVWQEYGPA